MPSYITRALTVDERIALLNQLRSFKIYFHNEDRFTGEKAEARYSASTYPHLFYDFVELCGYRMLERQQTPLEPEVFFSKIVGLIGDEENNFSATKI